MNRKRIYISGPMRGYELYNFPAFDEARDLLKANGSLVVVSPADMDREEGFDPEKLPKTHNWDKWPNELSDNIQDVIFRDLCDVLSCDAIFMLEGWRKSKGAKAELAVAEWADKQVHYQAYEDYLND